MLTLGPGGQGRKPRDAQARHGCPSRSKGRGTGDSTVVPFLAPGPGLPVLRPWDPLLPPRRGCREVRGRPQSKAPTAWVTQGPLAPGRQGRTELGGEGWNMPGGTKPSPSPTPTPRRLPRRPPIFHRSLTAPSTLQQGAGGQKEEFHSKESINHSCPSGPPGSPHCGF